MRSSTRIVARCFKQVKIGWICTQGTSPLEALKALISMAANHKQTVSVMHIDVSRASFHAKVQRLVLVRVPVERQDGRRCWGTWSVEEEYARHTRTQQAMRYWKQHMKSWTYHPGFSSKNLFRHEEHRVSGKTLGDDFVRPTDPLTEFKNKMTGVYPIKSKLISYGSTESIKAGESEELCISTIPDMSTCS